MNLNHIHVLSLSVLFIVYSCSSSPDNKQTNSSTTDTNAMVEMPKVFHYYLKGKLGEKSEIEMHLRKSEDNLAGYYCYSAINVPIQLSGTYNSKNFQIELIERLNTKQTGKFTGGFNAEGNFSGHWTNPENSKSFSFNLEKVEELMPWWSLTIPFHPVHIDGTTVWERRSDVFVDLNSKIDLKGLEMHDDSMGYDDLREEILMRTPYFEYELIGYKKNDYFVLANYSGGGTGLFSDIRHLRLEGNKLKQISLFGGGDRCNGGVSSTDYKKDKIYYSVNATPSEIVGVANYNGSVYFEYCAICCAGTIDFEYDIIKQENKCVAVYLDDYFFDEEAGNEDAKVERDKLLRQLLPYKNKELKIEKFKQLLSSSN